MKPRLLRSPLWRHALLGCVGLGGMTGALLAQESLLPPGFEKPGTSAATRPLHSCPGTIGYWAEPFL